MRSLAFNQTTEEGRYEGEYCIALNDHESAQR